MYREEREGHGYLDGRQGGLSLCVCEGEVLGVDGDDLATPTPHHQYSLQAFSEHIQELYVWGCMTPGQGGQSSCQT